MAVLGMQCMYVSMQVSMLWMAVERRPAPWDGWLGLVVAPELRT